MAIMKSMVQRRVMKRLSSNRGCSKRKVDLSLQHQKDKRRKIVPTVKIGVNGSLNACFADDQDDRILSTKAKSNFDTMLPSCRYGVHEERTCPTIPALLAPDTITVSGNDDQCVKKALQQAKLTKRYAEIMSMAKSDNLHQERERLERLNDNDELERTHQKERDAFRTALDMMERAVEFEDNGFILKELEILTQCSLSDYLYGSNSVMALRDLKTGKVLNPLEHLGLRIKKEFTDDDDVDQDTIFLITEVEEGEIL